jgi:hypothetical protein
MEGNLLPSDIEIDGRFCTISNGVYAESTAALKRAVGLRQAAN